MAPGLAKTPALLKPMKQGPGQREALSGIPRKDLTPATVACSDALPHASKIKPRAWKPDAGPHIGGQELGPLRRRSGGPQILSRGLARPSIGNHVEGDLLSFVEPVHPCAFDRADVHEDVLAAVIRLDEAESFLAIEPFHGSLRHM